MPDSHARAHCDPEIQFLGMCITMHEAWPDQSIRPISETWTRGSGNPDPFAQTSLGARVLSLPLL